jgi:ATP-dependent Clp protease ATP-binding subunit ClpB
MKRVLQKEVVDKLSKKLLAGEYVAGNTIYVHTDRKGLIFDDKPHAGQNTVSKTSKQKISTTSDTSKTTTSTPKPKTKEELLAEKRKRQLDELKKATKEVEDSVKDINKSKGKKD